MIDELILDTTPTNEPCAQVGTDQYYKNTMAEARAHILQIQAQLTPPLGVTFAIQGHPHDFGTYHQIHVSYNDQIPEHRQYISKLESEAPEDWTSHSKQYLKDLGYPFGPLEKPIKPKQD